MNGVYNVNVCYFVEDLLVIDQFDLISRGLPLKRELTKFIRSKCYCRFTRYFFKIESIQFRIKDEIIFVTIFIYERSNDY
jgi:hypothetical protein